MDTAELRILDAWRKAKEEGRLFGREHPTKPIHFPDDLPPGARVMTYCHDLTNHQCRPELALGTFQNESGHAVAALLCGTTTNITVNSYKYDVICSTRQDLYNLSSNRTCAIDTGRLSLRPILPAHFPSNTGDAPKILNQNRSLSPHLWLRIMNKLIDNVCFNPHISLKEYCDLEALSVCEYQGIHLPLDQNFLTHIYARSRFQNSRPIIPGLVYQQDAAYQITPWIKHGVEGDDLFAALNERLIHHKLDDISVPYTGKAQDPSSLRKDLALA